MKRQRRIKRFNLSDLKKFKLTSPIHPFLFAIYPILFIYSSNIDELFLLEILNPIIVSLGAATLIFISLRFVLKDPNKAAFLTTIILVAFFSYGHIFSLMEGIRLEGTVIGRNKYLLPLTLILLASISLLTWRLRANFERLSKYLNLVVAILILVSFIKIGNYAFSNKLNIVEHGAETISPEAQQATEKSNRPDIYYLILDGYAREDTLKTVFNYDNSEFISYLKKNDFFIADESRSNYSLSLLSMASSLNMNYVNDAGSTQTLIDLIHDNKVTEYLKSKGYLFINIGTGWEVTNKNPYADKNFFYRERSEFTKILYQTTALILLERFQLGDAKSVLFAFDKASEIPEINEPTFTYIHIVSPHPPYLFDRAGNIIQDYHKGLGDSESWGRKEKYIDQLIFISKKTQELIDHLLSKSKTPPIVILQADHGPGSTGGIWTKLERVTRSQFVERMDILSAYYFPNNGEKVLYSSITPVNSFRKLFNYYFGENYKPLEDKSYLSRYKNYFRFVTINKQGKLEVVTGD